MGDTVTLAFRVRLDERDLLFDTVPQPAVTPPDWIRILSVEKLQRQPDRIFVGRARIAFYRPGTQAVPRVPAAVHAVGKGAVARHALE